MECQLTITEVEETNDAVTQFVGDNIDLNIVSIHQNTPFYSMGWIQVTSAAPSLQDPPITVAVCESKLKATEKVKILKETEVNILSRKQMEITSLTFLPMAELFSSYLLLQEWMGFIC